MLAALINGAKAVPTRIAARLNGDWRTILKHWSTQLAGLGLVLSTLFAKWPSIGLDMWNAMPAEVKAFLPQQIVTVVPAGLFALVIVAKFVKQKGLADAAA